MPRAAFSVLLLLVLTTAGGLASASPKPPTREQLFYARRELELEAQLAKIQRTYTDTNPRVVAVQKEIDFCRQHTTLVALSRVRRGRQPAIQTLEEELVTKQDELYHLKTRYTDTAPPVKAAQQSVNDLEREIALRRQK